MILKTTILFSILLYSSVFLFTGCEPPGEGKIAATSQFRTSGCPLTDGDKLEILSDPEDIPKSLDDTYILYVARSKSGETVNVLAWENYSVTESTRECFFISDTSRIGKIAYFANKMPLEGTNVDSLDVPRFTKVYYNTRRITGDFFKRRTAIGTLVNYYTTSKPVTKH